MGDAFCGGGSVPFEAARLGCEVFASDLNPLAALLTWGALNIIGGGEASPPSGLRTAQAEVFDAVDRQITAWRIEHNETGWRADAFLYCTETALSRMWLAHTACSELGYRRENTRRSLGFGLSRTGAVSPSTFVPASAGTTI